MLRQIVLYLIVLFLSVTLLGCQSEGETEAPDGRLQLVATYSILGDLVQQVGQEHIALTTLVGPGSDTHTFEPGPADSAALAQADLIFENGLGFEGWLNEMYEASGSTAERIAVTAGLTLIPAGEDSGEFDPHVWHDVANAIEMVKAIRDELAAADPANAAAYQANATTYMSQLEALDEWVFAQVERLPAGQRKLVTSHDTFSYFAGRYGFAIVGTALGLSTETADPSAGEMAALVEEIRAAGMPAVFIEQVANSAVMEQIAAEAGVRLGPPLYTDALGPPGSEADSYLKLIRYNVTAIVNTLLP